MRKIAMWIIYNIPIGRLAPCIFAYAIGVKKWKRTDNKRIHEDAQKDAHL